MSSTILQKNEWDHSSDKKFVDYYATESESESTTQRFTAVFERIRQLRQKLGLPENNLHVADIGCATGHQAFLWAEAGHFVHALDVNQPLIDVAEKRAIERGYKIDFRLGSASELPWENNSMDVCIALELLEHIEDWRACLDDFTRVLKPGGILCLSTTNKLCPVQQEFSLPFYSWYPSGLKRRYEELARTTRSDLVNFATYPAVNWFSFYSLRAAFKKLGYQSFDKFDLAALAGGSLVKKVVIAAIRTLPPLRFLAHVATPGTFIIAVKQ